MGDVAGAASISDAALAVLAADSYTCQATFTAGDVEVCLTERDGVVIAAFRGTERASLEDWIRDFAAWPDRCREHAALGWCHAGFLNGGEFVWPLIRPSFIGRRIILTGHSLGGAIAAIVAGLMVCEGMRPEILVTFGAPRVGGRKLVSLLSPPDHPAVQERQ